MVFGKIKRKLQGKLAGKFEIDEQILQEFCETNAKRWNVTAADTAKTDAAKPDKGKADRGKKGCIFIGLFMVEKWIPWLQPKMLYSKGLEEKSGCKPIVIDWEYNEQLVRFYASYGIDYISLKQEMFGDFAGCLYGLCRALGFFLFGGTGKKMAAMNYKGLEAGHFMFDTVIRTNQEIYTIRRARNKICVKKVWTGFWTLHTLDKLCRKYQPEYYFFDDLVYDEGMIATLLKARGAKVCKCELNGTQLHPAMENGEIYWPDFERQMLTDMIEGLSEAERKEYREAADKLLSDRFQAKNGDVRDSKAAFIGKKEADREELEKKMGLHKGRKNVVVCCHTLSESAHRCSEQAYEDTYTWVEETMKFVRDKNNANWIIKVHPIAAMKYGEGGVVEGLYEKYKSDNLFLFPDEYNSALVGQLADAVITIYGTVGCEYSCLGIPVILAGKAVYSGFGYTVDAFTREEYEKVLAGVQNVEPLTEEQKAMAKLVFTCQNRRKEVEKDSFAMKITEFIWQMDSAYMAGESMRKLNGDALVYVGKEVSAEELRQTDYYQGGLKAE